MISQYLLKNAEHHLNASVMSYALPIDRLLIRESATFGEALAEFTNPIDVVFVVDDLASRKLKGLLTRSDAKAAQLRDVSLSESVMSVGVKHVVILRDNNTVNDAVRVFSGNNPLGIPIDFIPICRTDNVIVGYLAAGDLLKRIVAPLRGPGLSSGLLE